MVADCDDDIPLARVCAKTQKLDKKASVATKHVTTETKKRIPPDSKKHVTPDSKKRVTCSDITNTLVGISGETARWRESLALFSTQCCHLSSSGSVFTAGVSHHTPPPLGGAGLVGLYIQF